MSDKKLRSALIRLASEKPELRGDLLPLLQGEKRAGGRRTSGQEFVEQIPFAVEVGRVERLDSANLQVSGDVDLDDGILLTEFTAQIETNYPRRGHHDVKRIEVRIGDRDLTGLFAQHIHQLLARNMDKILKMVR